MLSFVRLLKKFVQLQLFVEKATGDRQKVYPPLAGYTWAPFENSFLFFFLVRSLPKVISPRCHHGLSVHIQT